MTSSLWLILGLIQEDPKLIKSLLAPGSLSLGCLLACKKESCYYVLVDFKHKAAGVAG